MLDKILSSIAAVLVPGLGLLLRASRRNRLRARIDDYLALADTVEARDPAAAIALSDLAAEAVGKLVEGDQRWLRRRLDPSAVIALLFLTVPPLIAFAWAWTVTAWWKWPIIVVSGVWVALWGGVGVTQLFKEHELTT
jgi:hypothetical protein